MRTDRFWTALAAAALVGWIISVLLCNWTFYTGIVNYEVLYRNVAACWDRALLLGTWDRLRILAIRLLEMAGVAAVARCQFRKAGSFLVLFFIGFGGGMFLSLLVWSRGIVGVLLFLGAGFPQNLCYLLCIILLLSKGCTRSMPSKERFFCVTVFLFASGILLELYVNPLLVRLF